MARTYIQDLLSENERILLETHQHWFVLFNKIFLEIILIVIIIAASLFAAAYYPIAIAGLILVLVPLAGMLKDITVWRNQAYLVTTRRVIQISGVLNKDVVDSSLEKVNDVKIEPVLFRQDVRLWGCGDPDGQRAGGKSIPPDRHPVEFKTAMLNAKEKLGFEEFGMAVHAAEDIPAMIEKLDVLRKRGVLSES